MVLKAARILYLESSRFAYKHVERALVENTATTRMTPAHVGTGILFVHNCANHFTVIYRVKSR
jgi:hypothetical protein